MIVTARPIRELLDDAQALFDDSDYPAALRALEHLGEKPGILSNSRYVFLLSRTLRALSHYDAAADTLGLLHRDSFLVSRAEAEAAQIAWIRHDYDAGVEAAMHALRANPTNPAAQAVLRRVENPVTPPAERAPVGGVAHAAFYVSDGGNFGDVVLPLAVREALTEATGTTEWLPLHVHQVFDDRRRELVNAQRAIVVGGGGLFLPDTSPNGNSGWQWNIPPEQLAKIDVPLAAFAVGYNLFAGQQFHGDLFRENLVALAEKARFLGLRNHGSVERVRAELPHDLQEKVRFVPCPTTILERIHSDLEPATIGSGKVLVNAAYDRSARRFGAGYDLFLEQMDHFVDRVERAGAEVRFASHLPGDERFVRDLEASFGRSLPVERLNLLSPEQGYRVYRDASLVVGMRGHASMIPFGLGTPILSIVSHPKMRYFLEDIGRPEWAFDVDDAALGERMGERALDVLAAEGRYRADVASLQDELKVPITQAAQDLLGSA